MKLRFTIINLLLLSVLILRAQSDNQHNVEGKSFEEVKKLYKKAIDIRDTIALDYALELVRIAKMENNPFHLFYGYYASMSSNKKIEKNYIKSLEYADSALVVYKEGYCEEYFKLKINLADVYFFKGVVYSSEYYKHKEALTLFLLGNQALERCPDEVSERLIQSAISYIYTEIGEYDKALKIDSALMVKKRNIVLEDEWLKGSFLIGIKHLAVSYMNVRKYNQALILIEEGVQKAKKFHIKKPYFYYLKSECYYRLQEYEKAWEWMERTKTHYTQANKEYSYDLFLMEGLILHQLKQPEKGTLYLRKMDSVIFLKKDFNIESVEGYKQLINYYKSKQQLDNQYYYLNRFIYVDSILDVRYKSFSKQLKERYEIPNLVKEKETVIQQLKEQKETHQDYVYGLAFLGLALGGLGIHFYRKQQTYKKAYKKLQNDHTATIEEEKQQAQNTDFKEELNFSETLFTSLQKKISRFEQERGYLSSDLTLQKMASLLETNSSYLSKMINHQKQKNFATYLNDLRVDDSIEALQNNAKLRKYTIKALAEEAGFNSSQAYSKAFYKRTGIYPSYFIKQLEKDEKN